MEQSKTMGTKNRSNCVTILCLVVSIFVSDVALIGAAKVEIPDDVLSILRDGPDADINWCNLWPLLPRCGNLTTLFDDDVQLQALQDSLMKIDAGFDWCRLWPFKSFPFCQRSSAATTASPAIVTSTPSTNSTSANTSHVSDVTTRPNMTTTTHMTTSAPRTNVTTVPWTEPHANETTISTWGTSSTEHTKVTTSSSFTSAGHTTITPINPTTSPTGHGDPFSYKWFFVGFVTMLAIIVVVVILAVVVKRVCHARGSAQEPGYSPL